MAPLTPTPVPDPAPPVVLRARALTRLYPALTPGQPALELFRDLDLVVHAGEMVAIIGQSGAGKSSLLHLLAALDRPTSGEVWCASADPAHPTDVTALTPTTAARFRNRDIGFVWQFHYLLPEFTALENIALPLLARGLRRPAALTEAAAWLERVELSPRASNRAGELSGGEQQRVSIARALVTAPRLLLADEPTGDLDPTTAEHIFTLLARLQREHALAAVLVTHNAEFARRCDRVLRLQAGRLVPV